jgi:ubiquinone/menaquinone biosynthesis C-methylase UbiE
MDNQAGQALWRGIDFSGITVIVGVGTGRMIELVAQRVAASDGRLIVVDPRSRRLETLEELAREGLLLPIQGRQRQIPVVSETVDLLVVNGVLREVPEARLTAIFEEYWRVLVPGGQLRVSDIIAPLDAEHNLAWQERNRTIRKIGDTLDRPAALAVDLTAAARAMQSAGFENLKCSLLPGYALTDAWLEETVHAIRAMTARIVEPSVRHEIVQSDLPRLTAAYAVGDQRAAERFVLAGRKVGNLALDMRASFTEEDLVPPID